MPKDAGKCRVTVSVTTADATTVTLKDGKSNAYAVVANTTAAIAVDVPVGGETFTLSFGGATNPSVTISAACIDGTTADSSGLCKAPVPLSYDNVHVAVRFHNLGLIDAAGQFVQATNKQQAGDFC